MTCYDSGTIGRVSSDGEDLPAYSHDKDGNKFVGPNDFAPDDQGGIFFTTSGGIRSGDHGRVFYMAVDGTIGQKASDVHSANGLAISKDSRC